MRLRLVYGWLTLACLATLATCVYVGWPYWVEVWRIESATR